jgi:CRISPR-associated protein Csb2
MLALEIEYLSGLVYAADFRSRDRPEWPPHPARLFSALVAASYQSDLEEAGLEVLRWLEEQKPPSIACGHASKRTVLIIFVPVNDNTGEAVLPQFRTRRPRTFPCAVPDDPKIYFIWPDAQPTERQRAWLGRIAENVTYLGSSRSLVRVVLCNAPPPPNLAPAESGEHALRVVGPGRVDELAILFDLGRRPTPGILQPYAPLSSQQSESHYPTEPAALRDFFAFRCISGRHYPSKLP